MIAIVNYGLGNVKAFANLYESLNIPVAIASNARDLKPAQKIILPGVGSFDRALELLDASGMRPMLEEKVRADGVPVLGICVGMQMLANSSQEGCLPGLGWIEGEVKKFGPRDNSQIVRTPHMGWNTIRPSKDTELMKGLDAGSSFYFLHSYYFECKHPMTIAAVTDYGGEFASAVAADNVYGVQFHPEKSHGWGKRLLENFARL